MGIFGWINRKMQAVDEVVDKVVDEAWKKFTGEAKFEEADSLYNNVMKRFNEHKLYFEQELDKVIEEIDEHVNAINDSKIKIKKELFPAFADKIGKLKDVSISPDFIKDCYFTSDLKIDEMKIKSELYLIDFKKDPFKCNALAVISLGFYTRKKAKETLLKVEEENKRLKEEEVKMDSELEKLKRIEEALSLIEDYYASLINIYYLMLNRLDNSVNFLMIRCISFAQKIVRSQMSIKLLPVSQQKEIEAMYTISCVMKRMINTQITLNGYKDTVSNTKDMLEKQSEEVKKVYEAA